MIIEFGSKGEVEALLRASVTFKFQGSEESDIFAGSPIHSKALQSLLASLVEAEGPAAGLVWKDTYRLSGHAERWNFVAKYAARHPRWNSLSDHERVTWIETVAAPYEVTEADAAELQEKITEIHCSGNFP
ncbi:hypothetical protein AB0O20_12515 [Streptomyces kronopolitis]|uniref:hypothetical protein n=1 Tax=Streptomyces kronopolitis TaxID=1612435 RepID=UPI00341589E3